MDRSTVKLHGLHHDVRKEELLAFLNSIRMPAEAARIVIDDETGKPTGQGFVTFSDRMQAVEVIKALHDASPSEVTRRGGKLCAEIVYADVHATTNKGRPRNLRKKHASEDEQGSADEHEMDSMRERIAAVRLKEKRRNENSTLSGGGNLRPWSSDGFLQWQASQHAVRPDHADGSAMCDDDPSSPILESSSPQSRDHSPVSRNDEGVWGDEMLSKDETSGVGAREEWEPLDASTQQALKARGLRAVLSREKGRSLVATRPFKPGDIILEQEPLAWALFPHGQNTSKWADAATTLAQPGAAGSSTEAAHHFATAVGADPSPLTFGPSHGITAEMTSATSSERCHFCLKVHENLRRCSACKYAHYCCAAHQKNDWPTHKADCIRRARNDPARPPTPMVTMLAQISDVSRAACGGEQSPPAGRRIQDLNTLAAHYSEQSMERRTGYAQIVRLWAEYVGYSEDNPPPENEMRASDLLHTLCRLACNCHTITDSDLRPVGVGIFPLAALVNHSCRPSAVQTFAGRSIRIRAASSLKEGDEVTISYLDLADPLAARQAELRSRYLFQCACDVCAAAEHDAKAIPENERDKEGVLASAAQVSIALEVADAALSVEEGRSEAAGRTPQLRLEQQMKAIGMCQGALHPRHIRLLRLREAASRLAIQVQDWRAAANLISDVVDTYRHVYPPGWPVLGVQLALFGKILLHLGREAEAVPVLRQAISILDRTAGGGAGSDKDLVLAQSEALLREAEWSLSGMGELA